MNAEDRIDSLFIFLGGCLALLFVAIIFIKLIVCVYMPFLQERDFILSKIMWTCGEKRKHWKKELKRLYIGLIPVVGPMFADISRKIEKRRRL